MSGLKNILEDMVAKELDNVYQRYLDICKCKQCTIDVIAITLNQIPPQYVTGKRASKSTQNALYEKYNTQINEVLGKAIEKVKNRPRPECEKYKSNIFIDQAILTFYRH